MFHKNALRRFIAGFVSVALVLSSIGTAQAAITGLTSLNGMINGMFTAMGSPTVVNTANSRVFSAGYIEARNQIVSANLIAFAPPHFSEGCGGVNMYFGSWSFINGAQLQQLLTAIGQAAATFLFQMAIQAMCSQCSSALDWLQQAVQKMNSMVHNSCQLAAGLLTNPQKLGTELWADLGSAKSDFGSAQDPFSSFFGAMSNSQDTSLSWSTLSSSVASQWGYSAFSTVAIPPGTTAATCADFASLGNSVKFGNMTWKALVNNTAPASLGFANDQVLTSVLMSLIGTQIVLPSAQNVNPSNTSTNSTANGANTSNSTGQGQGATPEPPILRLKDLVDGTQTARVYQCLPFTPPGGGAAYSAYYGTCTTTTNLSPMGCLQVNSSDSYTLGTLSYGGIKNMVNCALYGVDTQGNHSTCSDWPDPITGNPPNGLVNDLISPTGQPSAGEIQVADMSPIPVYPLMQAVAHRPDEVRYIADQSENYIVAAVANEFTNDVITAIQEGMSNNVGGWKAPPKETQTLARMQKDRMFYENQLQGAVKKANELHTYVVTYLRSLNQSVRGLGTGFGH